MGLRQAPDAQGTRGHHRPELPLAEASVKVRTGPPHDEPEDYATDTWAGVLPAQLVFGAAEQDPELRAGVSVPVHIRALAGQARGR